MTTDLMEIGKQVKVELDRSAVLTPQNYSFENALKAAWLVLQETLDKNKNRALDVCSRDSIYLAILNMGLQGLNPIKDQCYFVVYGKKLECIRSYMGSEMVAKSVNPAIADIRAQCIFENDTIDINLKDGKTIVRDHKISFPDMANSNIIGAYVLAIGVDESILFSDLMTMDEIKQSWRQSKIKIIDDDDNLISTTTHARFSIEMAKRTVINRLCKRIINTSNDQALLESYRKTRDEQNAAQTIADEIEEYGNKKVLDFKLEKSDQGQVPSDGNKMLLPESMGMEASGESDDQVPMANEIQARSIIDLYRSLQKSGDVLNDISGFAGRKINRIRQLSESEADDYIAALQMEVESAQDQGGQEEHEPMTEKREKPDWA